MLSFAADAIKATTYGQKTFCKFLSVNDTNPGQSHQAGIYMPQNAYPILFDEPGVKGENKDRYVTVKWHLEEVFDCEVRFIYYGSGTRNEYRMTHTPVFSTEYTGALFVFVQCGEQEYQAFVLNTDEDINLYLDAFGLSPVDTNRIISHGIESSPDSENKLIAKFIEELNQKDIDFPNSETMSLMAQQICDAARDHVEFIVSNPDQKIVDWIDVEFNIFKALEYSRYGSVVKQGFETVDSFINLANQVLNRRKSRAGKSLEHHLAAIFKGNEIPFESQVVTEGNKRPDFIFPSSAAYHDFSFPTHKLVSLAAKTTCKDRWRQILNEADRLKNGKKYLCTLQQGVSLAQMSEMESENVVLVVPKPYIKCFPKEKQSDILSVGQFVSYLKSL